MTAPDTPPSLKFIRFAGEQAERHLMKRNLYDAVVRAKDSIEPDGVTDEYGMTLKEHGADWALLALHQFETARACEGQWFVYEFTVATPGKLMGLARMMLIALEQQFRAHLTGGAAGNRHFTVEVPLTTPRDG